VRGLEEEAARGSPGKTDLGQKKDGNAITGLMEPLGTAGGDPKKKKKKTKTTPTPTNKKKKNKKKRGEEGRGGIDYEPKSYQHSTDKGRKEEMWGTGGLFLGQEEGENTRLARVAVGIN